MGLMWAFWYLCVGGVVAAFDFVVVWAVVSVDFDLLVYGTVILL